MQFQTGHVESKEQVWVVELSTKGILHVSHVRGRVVQVAQVPIHYKHCPSTNVKPL